MTLYWTNEPHAEEIHILVKVGMLTLVTPDDDLFRRTDCVVHLVPGIDAVTEDETCTRCGARREWVVPVEIDWDRAYLEGAENGIDDIAVRAILAMALGIRDDDE